MNIAINTRFLLPQKMEGFGWYTYEISRRIVENHPEHTFYFFFDRPFDKRFIFAKNVVPVILKPQARHPILFYLWFEFAVTKALKKYNIDVFFSPDGYLSLKTDVTQVATIHDINFEHFPKDLPFTARIYLRHFFPKFAKKAAHIITVSEYSKRDICQTYQIDPSNVSAIWNGASDLFRPLSLEQKNEVKKSYSDTRDYFLFVGSIHPRKNITRLIQSYQKYKEKYPDGYDLVIVGDALWSNINKLVVVPVALKKSIHFTGHLKIEDLVKITAAASCLTYVPYFEGFGIPLVEAMKCAVPIISGNLTSLPEVVGDAGILVNPYSIDEICEAMEKIYLDAGLRQKLSGIALERSTSFSWDQAAEKVWEVILEQGTK